VERAVGRKSRAVEQYFEQIDTPMKAYLLGLLAADGSIYVNKARAEYKVSLKLHRDDEILVHRLRDTIAPTVNFTYPTGRYIRFEVCSLRMINDLARFGIVPRKTWNLPWPSALPEAMAMPFLLGYFDGDGTLVGLPPRPHKGMHEPYLYWQVVGHYDFLLEVRKRIHSWCGVEIAPPRLPHAFTSFLYCIATSGEKAEAVDKVLNSSGLGLPRKHIPGVWARYEARMEAKKSKDRTSE
jgi:hypothetical protein